ncbi:aldo/keto reductase [uncultured Bifidobacterium sp.]|uniref:aldo/keto reductase n=1 Tax=uncultured Bifidobacterium sp. TaxID=165187 RepID=UPI00261F4800|nr:aldo/keto reductase [uncultured Bifidobacterium sp.]
MSHNHIASTPTTRLRLDGGSAVDILPLVLGGNTFGWTSDETSSRRVLDSFIDNGGSLIDTADVYSAWAPGHSGGESEIILGRWLETSGHRRDALIATKVSEHPQYHGLGASTIAAAARESLLRLGTDHIDLYYAHFDDQSTPLAETAAAFDKLVREGLVRAVGLSNYTPDRIREWFDIARREGFVLPVALEPHYNLVHRAAFEAGLDSVAQSEDLAVFPYFALASGFLTGKYHRAEDAQGSARSGMLGDVLNDDGFAVVERLSSIAAKHDVQPATVALAWLRHRPAVSAPIASARTVDQLPALIESASQVLDDEDMSSLTKVSQPFA